MNQTSLVAVVTGIGPGTGEAIARRFARGGYAVAMLAHDRNRLTLLARETAHSRAYPCDVTEEEGITKDTLLRAKICVEQY